MNKLRFSIISLIAVLLITHLTYAQEFPIPPVSDDPCYEYHDITGIRKIYPLGNDTFKECVIETVDGKPHQMCTFYSKTPVDDTVTTVRYQDSYTTVFKNLLTQETLSLSLQAIGFLAVVGCYVGVNMLSFVLDCRCHNFYGEKNNKLDILVKSSIPNLCLNAMKLSITSTAWTLASKGTLGMIFGRIPKERHFERVLKQEEQIQKATTHS